MQQTKPAALITGAARGLGAETALQLAAQGWCVMLVDACADDPALPYHLATAADLELQLANCRALAGSADQVAAKVCDVRRQEDVDVATKAAVEQFGRLDAVVAAAGVIAGGPPVWEMPEEAWHVQLDVNLTGVWRLARAAVPALLAQPEPRRGRFIAVSSAAGLRGFRQLAAYAATKHGVIGLVRSLAVELASTGITANAVCPGSMDTAILAATADIYGLSDVQDFARHHLTKQLLHPREVASLIAWLCSPASSAVTGAALPADAGLTAK